MIPEVKKAIIIYSRIGSQRLPGKALMSLGDYSLLGFIINRLTHLQSELEATIIIATTISKHDDPIVALAKSNNIEYFRGDEHDLIKRTVDLISKFKVRSFCRVNGDCPFVDPDLIKLGFLKIAESFEFVSNIITRTFPYGIAVECIKSTTYLKYASTAFLGEKEHVTKHLYRHLDELEYYSIVGEPDLTPISLTVDTYEDLQSIRKLLSKLDLKNPLNISFKQLINLYDNSIQH